MAFIRPQWYLILSLMLSITACSVPETVSENLAALCAIETYTVTTNDFHDTDNALCNYATGRCNSVKAALNTANVCREHGRKTVALKSCAVYAVEASDNESSLYRLALRDYRSRAGRSTANSAAPLILGRIRIIGNGAIIRGHERLAETASGWRGRIFEIADTANVEIWDLIIQDFGIHNSGGLRLSHVGLIGNNSHAASGAVFNTGELTITDNSLFAKNYNWEAGDIWNEATGSLVFDKSKIGVFESTALGSGLNLSDVGPAQKHSSIRNFGEFTFQNSTVENLVLSVGVINNGGEGQLTILNSTFHNISPNVEGRRPGMIGAPRVIIDNTASLLRISSSTFNGGELWGVIDKLSNERSAEVILEDLTITDVDLAPRNSTGGMEIYDPANAAIKMTGNIDLTISNSVIANINGDNCRFAGDAITSRFSANVATDDSCGFEQIDDPQLVPIRSNGGYTQTRLPLSTSFLVDNGDSILPVDQRGAVRNADGNGDGRRQPDIGAAELGASAADAEFSRSLTACAFTGRSLLLGR